MGRLGLAEVLGLFGLRMDFWQAAPAQVAPLLRLLGLQSHTSYRQAQQFHKYAFFTLRFS
jgi:hypothetical protein